MPTLPKPIIGAILAGGRSARMGQPKHLLTLPDGRTFLRAMIDVLQPITERIAIVGRVTLPADTAASDKIVMIEDLRANRGPVGGIEALLASGCGDRYLAVGCDMPLLQSAALEPLIARVMADDQPAMVVYESANRVEPLPCVISAGALQHARALLETGRASMRSLAKAAGAVTIAIGADAAQQLRSINTPEQLTDLGGCGYPNPHH